jgi:branched-subunit amino acid ABC-type transport system permease component
VLASATTLLQHGVDGLINGSAYGLLGLSFGLVVAVSGRFHFAWAAAYTIAGFFAAYLASHSGVPPVPAIVVSIFGAIVFNLLLESLLYRPIAIRAGPAALLGIFVASFGVTIAVGNAITWAVGTTNNTQTLTWISTSTLHIGRIVFTVLDVVWVASVWACGLATWALLRYTPLGRRIRAVQVNPEMSEAVGINAERIYLIVFALSALLGGWAAVLTSMKYAGTPTMGLTPVFYAFVVAFTAGLGRSPLRIMLVGTAIGIVEGLTGEYLSVEWQEVVVFGILLIYLVFKAAAAWRPSLFAKPKALIRIGVPGG